MNIPEGYVLVPIDPIKAIDMGWAYLDAAREAEPNKTHSFSHAGYRAMVDAAPKVESQDLASEAALREELATIRADRDAEKEMKAKARGQRDVQTIRAGDLQQRLTVADQYVQRLIDCSKGKDSIATGYLSDILDVLKSAAGCEHSFHYFGDYPRRRCNNCNALEVAAEGEGS